jgi:CPA1 family monovalent cation:H+ antiporter
MDTFLEILILLFVVSLSGIAVRFSPFHIPLPLIQIVIGAILTWLPLGIHVKLTPELFLMLFIPPLLFSDGRKTPVSQLIIYGREIVSLALVLVLVTVFGIGYLIHLLLPEIPLAAAFALAAVLSPTDAVALSGIVGKGSIAKPVMSVVEGEALMNDASGLVSFNVAIAVAIGAITFSASEAFFTFLKMAIGGGITGVVIVFVYVKIFTMLNKTGYRNASNQIIFSLLLPFFAYLLAERFNFSGILAAVTAGMAVGQSKLNRDSPDVTLRTDSLWETLEFTFNGMVFVILGFQIPTILESTVIQSETSGDTTLNKLVLFVIIVYLGLMLVRFSWLYTMRAVNKTLLKKRPSSFSNYTIRDMLVISISGVRGAVTLAGVLSIPLLMQNGMPFPGRYQLIFISSGVILLSIVCAIIILPILLTKNQKNDPVDLTDLNKITEMVAVVSQAAVNEVKIKLESDKDNNFSHKLIDDVSQLISNNLKSKFDLYKVNHSDIITINKIERELYLASIHAIRNLFFDLYDKKKISDDIFTIMIQRLNAFEVSLRI